MIKNLTGVYETVEYENKRAVMLYDNDETEAYPTHWHNAVEIIIPPTNDFSVISGDKEYILQEKDGASFFNAITLSSAATLSLIL